ncbi:MAG: galactokinase [Eubacteriaceae bacterium]|nr:galactokinase [Eubacteriaceae bacterium]
MPEKERFELLYAEDWAPQMERAEELIREFERHFQSAPASLITAPGRSEIIGNHTDHQNGRVVAAAIDSDIMAAASPRDDGRVTVYSSGFAGFSLDISDTSVVETEAYTSAALVRGIADALRSKGLRAAGFDAVMESRVDVGSGLSSSAAFENLIVGIFSHLFNDGCVSEVDTALISRYSENNYFMKPCGLEDQLASALGGISFIDFRESLSPSYEALRTDFEHYGHSLVITNAGASHADLTDDYAAITREMYAVAGYFGRAALREVDPSDFYGALPQLRREFGDRAVLRSHHFFEEDQRPAKALDCLKNDDFDGFLALLNESGMSSSLYLQNIYPAASPASQSLGVALMYAKKLLNGRGSARVHGGGFAGTIACLVPTGDRDDFIREMNGLFGEGSARVYRIRKHGVFRLF